MGPCLPKSLPAGIRAEAGPLLSKPTKSNEINSPHVSWRKTGVKSLKTFSSFPISSMLTQSKPLLSLLLASGSLILAFGPSAQAAPACTDGTLTALQAAGTCTDTLGFTFTLNSFSNFNNLDRFSFQSSGSNFQYSLQGFNAWNPSGGPYGLNYTLTAPTGKQFRYYTSNLSSSNAPLTDAGTYVVSSATQPSANSTFTPPLSASGGLKTYSPFLTTDTFTSTLSVTGGTIASVTGVVASTPLNTSAVPTPLPLLGVVGGYRLARKFRKRIKNAQ